MPDIDPCELVPNTEHIKTEDVKLDHNQKATAGREEIFLNYENSFFEKCKSFILSTVFVIFFVFLFLLFTMMVLISINSLFKTDIEINLKTMFSAIFLLVSIFIITRQS